MEIRDKCGMIMIPVRGGHMEYADDDIQIEARILMDDGIRVIIKWNMKGGKNGNDTDNTKMPNMRKHNANTR